MLRRQTFNISLSSRTSEAHQVSHFVKFRSWVKTDNCTNPVHGSFTAHEADTQKHALHFDIFDWIGGASLTCCGWSSASKDFNEHMLHRKRWLLQFSCSTYSLSWVQVSSMHSKHGSNTYHSLPTLIMLAIDATRTTESRWSGDKFSPGVLFRKSSCAGHQWRLRAWTAGLLFANIPLFLHFLHAFSVYTQRRWWDASRKIIQAKARSLMTWRSFLVVAVWKLLFGSLALENFGFRGNRHQWKCRPVWVKPHSCQEKSCCCLHPRIIYRGHLPLLRIPSTFEILGKLAFICLHQNEFATILIAYSSHFIPHHHTWSIVVIDLVVAWSFWTAIVTLYENLRNHRNRINSETIFKSLPQRLQSRIIVDSTEIITDSSHRHLVLRKSY